MSAPLLHPGPVGPDTLITVKVLIEGTNRRFKLALRDLGAHVLPQKLRVLLAIPPECEVKFDRFSDSAASYITLDSTNPSVYKQLYRAAKAKLKLRLKVTVFPPAKPEEEPPIKREEKATFDHGKAGPRNTYLETVLSHLPAPNDRAPSFKSFQMASPHIPPPPPLDSRPTVQASVRCHGPAVTTRAAELSRATLPTLSDFHSGTFSIDCNSCGKSVMNEHYHCSICERGDFDLCQTCIDLGITCNGDDHWLIKRFIKNGRVFPSTTETLPPHKKNETPDAPAPKPESTEEDERTCNSCIIQLPASSFVTCQACPDFDLCFYCLEHGEHGHHPAHVFTPVDEKSAAVSSYVKQLCQQGRGLQHDAVCDGCDAQISGVRHKCLSCPDFDYCSTCVLSASEVHPGHRFAPLYDQLELRTTRQECHRGVYCDGPICAARAHKTYVRGDRYKCAVCDDTDFCANCEASPTNPHNKTHPLIKIRTPIRHVSISTVNELDNGSPAVQLGDRPLAKNAATETTRSTSTNAATQVQTMAEVKPVEMAPVEVTPVELAPVQTPPPVEEEKPRAPPSDLQAWFESDSTPDGSTFGPNRLVSQSWTLRNPGPEAWPAGCAVYYIGGDDMRNLDDKHPSSVSTMTVANRSNVLEHVLEPSKTAVFSVFLKSPARQGRAISYWRLKTPDGQPFGHKLWVDITVASNAVPLVAAPVEPPTVVAPTPVPEEVNPAAEDKSQASSVMIFPKLEKESPESSTDNIKQEPCVAAGPGMTSAEQDLLDDLASMELEDESTEDGFMTDEEYDILDAEDEDYLMEAERAV